MSQWLDDAARPIQAGSSGWSVVSPDRMVSVDKRQKGWKVFSPIRSLGSTAGLTRRRPPAALQRSRRQRQPSDQESALTAERSGPLCAQGSRSRAPRGRSNAGVYRNVVAAAQMPAADGNKLCNLVWNPLLRHVNSCKTGRLVSLAKRIGSLFTLTRRRGAGAGRSRRPSEVPWTRCRDKLPHRWKRRCHAR